MKQRITDFVSAPARRFARDTRGNVAVMFGIVSTALVLASSVALTTLQMTEARTELQTAADSAALAAVEIADDGKIKNKDRRKRARAVLLNNLGDPSRADRPDFSIRIDQKNGVVRAEVSAEREIQPTFGGFLSRGPKIVRADAVASSADSSRHTNIYFLVDNSASMGVGQTAADRDNMIRDPDIRGLGKDPCAVACHVPEKPEMDTYAYYQSKGIRMRIDVLRDRVVEFLTQLNSDRSVTRRTQVAVRVTGDWEDAEPDMLKSSVSAAISDARAIELEGRDDRRATILAPAFRALAAHINRTGSQPGDGSHKDRPKTFVVLLTDGLENIDAASPDYLEGAFFRPESIAVRQHAETYLAEMDPARLAMMGYDDVYDYARANPHTTRDIRLQTLPPQQCDIIKDTGATLIVMNIDYGVPEYVSKSNGTFPRYDDPSVTRAERDRTQAVIDAKQYMRAELQKCASHPSLVFDAETETEMTRALEEIREAIYTRDDPRIVL